MITESPQGMGSLKREIWNPNPELFESAILNHGVTETKQNKQNKQNKNKTKTKKERKKEKNNKRELHQMKSDYYNAKQKMHTKIVTKYR